MVTSETSNSTEQSPQPQPMAGRFGGASRHSLVVSVISLLVIVAVIFSALFWHHHQQATPKGPLAYKYGRLDNYTLKGLSPTSGLSFSKPVQLTSFSGAQNHQIVFTQFAAQNPIETIANLNAASNYSAALSSAASKAAIGKTVTTDTSQSNYLHQYVSQWLSSYKVTFSPATVFQNPNIQNHAWQVDYSATVKSNTSHKELYPPLQGKAVMAIGKNTVYYLMADAVDYNWQAGQNTWQKVFDSIKIDQ